MVFITVSLVSVLIWSLLGQRKLFSASFANLIGTLVFVVLGLEFDPYVDFGTTVLIGIGFYLFLVIGERCARRIPINKQRFDRFGQALVSHRFSRFVFTLFFIAFGLLPVFQVISTGQSIGDLFTATWATNTTQQTSQMLIELSGRSATGAEALINGIQNQLIGFWYLSLGIILIRKSRWFLPVLVAYLFGSFLTSGGFRSLLIVSILLPVVLFFLSVKKVPRLRTIVLIGILGIGILLALDWLRYGRTGLAAEGSLTDRIDRTLRIDFAFGGLGLKLGLDNLPDSQEQGINYLVRTAILPIPRVLWPDKPALNPNQEYTEAATGQSYAEVGTILLFTPLGEALFNFGYFGLVVIPFLYGFVAVLMERLYSTSSVYKGLLAQVYIWAVLAMRLTFFNLFSVLVAANFILIMMLVMGAALTPSHSLAFAKPAQNG